MTTTKSKPTGYLRRIVSLLRWRYWPSNADSVPFSEIPQGQAFWWNGKCYVKETEQVVFLHEPMRRPFSWREQVTVQSLE